MEACDMQANLGEINAAHCRRPDDRADDFVVVRTWIFVVSTSRHVADIRVRSHLSLCPSLDVRKMKEIRNVK